MQALKKETVQRDVEGMRQAVQSGFPEGAVFFAGRAVAKLLQYRARHLGASRWERMAPGILLAACDLLPEGGARAAREVRCMALRAAEGEPISADDGQVMEACLHVVLTWFDPQTNSPPPQGPLAECVRQLVAGETAMPVDIPLKHPTPAAWLGEMPVEGDDAAGALDLLTRGLELYPESTRLRQMMGLYWSRQNDVAQALYWLEPLIQGRHADDETFGILGGACKRAWMANPHDRDWLLRAHTLYRQGWEQSHRHNPYLGINVATTALFLGQDEVCRSTAQHVCKQLTALQEVAEKHDTCLSLWDSWSLAEAWLLGGEVARAARMYHNGLQHPHQESQWEVALRQADTILRHLHLGSSVRLLAERHAELNRDVVRVAVLAPPFPGDDWRGVLDKLLLQLERTLGSAVSLIYPLESAGARQVVRRALRGSVNYLIEPVVSNGSELTVEVPERVRRLHFSQDDRPSPDWAVRHAVDQSQLLLRIYAPRFPASDDTWLRQAHSQGKPLILISNTAPFSIEARGLDLKV